MTMNIIEIKKALYKEKPIAYKNSVHHPTKNIYTSKLRNGQRLAFVIPKEESVDFEEKIEAQLLIRWLSESID